MNGNFDNDDWNELDDLGINVPGSFFTPPRPEEIGLDLMNKKLRSSPAQATLDNLGELQQQYREARELNKLFKSPAAQMDIVCDLASATNRWAPDSNAAFWQSAEQKAKALDEEDLQAQKKAEETAQEEATKKKLEPENSEASDQETKSNGKTDTKENAEDKKREREQSLKKLAAILVRAKLKPPREKSETTESIVEMMQELVPEMEKHPQLLISITAVAVITIDGCGARIEEAIKVIEEVYQLHKREMQKEKEPESLYESLDFRERLFHTRMVQLIKEPLEDQTGVSSAPLQSVHEGGIFDKLVGNQLRLITAQRTTVRDAATYDGHIAPFAETAVRAIKALKEGNKEEAFKILEPYLRDSESYRSHFFKRLQTQDNFLLDDMDLNSRLKDKHPELADKMVEQTRKAEKEFHEIFAREPYPEDEEFQRNKGAFMEKNISWLKEMTAATEKQKSASRKAEVELMKPYRRAKELIEDQLTIHRDKKAMDEQSPPSPSATVITPWFLPSFFTPPPPLSPPKSSPLPLPENASWALVTGKPQDVVLEGYNSLPIALIEMEIEAVRRLQPKVEEIVIGEDYKPEDKPQIWRAIELGGFSSKGYNPQSEDHKHLLEDLADMLKKMQPEQIEKRFKKTTLAKDGEPLVGTVVKIDEQGNAWIKPGQQRSVELVMVTKQQQQGIKLELLHPTPPGFEPSAGQQPAHDIKKHNHRSRTR